MKMKTTISKSRLINRNINFIKVVLQEVPAASCHPFKDSCQVIEPADAHKWSIFIFDDAVCDKEDKIKECFSCATLKHRHSLLCSMYSKIIEKMIRDNCMY